MSTNSILTIMLRREEMTLMRWLLDRSMPEIVDGVVQSCWGADAKTMSARVTNAVTNYMTLRLMLEWRPDDELRAYRQMNEVGVKLLQKIVHHVRIDRVPEVIAMAMERYGPGIEAELERAQALPVTPMWQAVDAKSPKAMA